VALTLVSCALAGAWLAARAAAPRASAAPVPAVEQAPVEPQGGGETPDTAAVTKRMVYGAMLPDSAGHGIAQRWCVLCHSAMLITQQAKDSTAWEKTIGQMEKWGVTLTLEEHDSLRTYLVKCFGPKALPSARVAAPVTTARETTGTQPR
jgi:hypothetical protein